MFKTHTQHLPCIDPVPASGRPPHREYKATPWLQWLWRTARPATPEPPEADVLIPHDRIGLLIQEDIPARWLPEGPHRLVLPGTRAEVRLIAADFIGGAIHGEPLQAAADLPYERALLFAGGSLVAMVRPAMGPTRPRPLPPAPCVSRPARLRPGREEDLDPVREYSFV